MKDYAKRPQPTKKAQPSNKNALLLLFLILCAAGLFALFADHVLHQPPIIEKTIQAKSAPPVIEKHKIKKKSLPVADNQPKYDFYKLLSKMTVVIPAEDESNNLTPASASVISPDYSKSLENK